MKLPINLPQFDGFYCSVFDDIYEIPIGGMDADGDVTQEDYDNIDWAKVHADFRRCVKSRTSTPESAIGTSSDMAAVRSSALF